MFGLGNKSVRYVLAVSAILAAVSAHGGTAVELAFQQPLQQKELLNLSVEIGGYDVTSFSEFGDDVATVAIGTELPEGDYLASVIAFYADGEVQTLAEQEITLLPQPSTSWQYNSTLNTSSRMDEEQNESFRGVDHNSANGGIDANITHTRQNLEFTANLQSVYDSNSANSTDGNEWSLSNYQMGLTHRGSYGSSAIFAGNTLVDQENMLFSSYQRRGVNAQLANADQSLRGGFFNVVSDTTIAYDDDLLSPDNSSEQTYGGYLTFIPLGAYPDRLRVGVGFVDGEGTTAGSGFTVNDSDTVYGGSSWNTTLDSLWLSRSLWLHLEYANSDFDSDGIGYGEGEQEDEAYKLLLNLNSNGDLPSLGLDYWDLTLQQNQVGADFYSISNLALAGDLESRRLTLSGNKGGLGFTLDVMRQENNVDHDPERATLSIDYSGLDLYYTPLINPERKIWGLLGSPSFYTYYHYTDSAQSDGDAQLAGFDVDNENREYSLGATFSNTTWSWGVSHTLTDIDDHSEAVFQNMVEIYTPQPDSKNRLTSLQLSWYPSSRLTVSPTLQWSEFDESRVDNEYKTFNAGIDTQVQLIPEKLLFTLNYFLTRNDNSFGDPQFMDSELDNYTGTFQLIWKALQARVNKPGLDLFFNGSYGRQQNKVANDDFENWQINLGFNLYWAGNRD